MLTTRRAAACIDTIETICSTLGPLGGGSRTDDRGGGRVVLGTPMLNGEGLDGFLLESASMTGRRTGQRGWRPGRHGTCARPARGE
jgi:hypothetical protein